MWDFSECVNCQLSIVLSLSGLSLADAAALTLSALGLAFPQDVSALLILMSTASCAPEHAGRPDVSTLIER